MARESRLSRRRVNTALNRKRAVELRLKGKSFNEIAQQLINVQTGRPISPKTAWQLVDFELKRVGRTRQEKGEVLLQLELEKLRNLEAGLMEKALTGDIKAVDAVLRLMQRRAKMVGLDSPIKVDQKVSGYAGMSDDEAQAEAVRRGLLNPSVN